MTRHRRAEDLEKEIERNPTKEINKEQVRPSSAGHTQARAAELFIGARWPSERLFLLSALFSSSLSLSLSASSARRPSCWPARPRRRWPSRSSRAWAPC